MRWRVLFVLVLIISLCQTASAYLYCADSDDGVIYDVPGKVYYSFLSVPQEHEVDTISDYCADETGETLSCEGDNCVIWEYSCTGEENDWEVQTDWKICTDLGYSGCSDGACYGTAPVPESCSDETQNQDETDIDCGGVCDNCDVGEGCNSATDCTTNICDSNICTEVLLDPYCLDEDDFDTFVSADLKYGYYNEDNEWNEGKGIENCIEGDLPAEDDKCDYDSEEGCYVFEAYCNESDPWGFSYVEVLCEYGCEDGACREADFHCNNSVQDFDEDGEDCGGAYCELCEPIVVETCYDEEMNQDESDVDCGGVCGATCVEGQDCVTSADCESSICEDGVCVANVDDPTIEIDEEIQEALEITLDDYDISIDECPPCPECVFCEEGEWKCNPTLQYAFICVDNQWIQQDNYTEYCTCQEEPAEEEVVETNALNSLKSFFIGLFSSNEE